VISHLWIHIGTNATAQNCSLCRVVTTTTMRDAERRMRIINVISISMQSQNAHAKCPRLKSKMCRHLHLPAALSHRPGQPTRCRLTWSHGATAKTAAAQKVCLHVATPRRLPARLTRRGRAQYIGAIHSRGLETLSPWSWRAPGMAPLLQIEEAAGKGGCSR